MKGGKIDNLRTPTSEEARRIGAMGGRKSVEVRQRRKLLSAEYAAIIANGLGLKNEGMTLEEVVGQILSRRDSASVAMLKEVREATEGNKLSLSGDDDAPPVQFNFVAPRKHGSS